MREVVELIDDGFAAELREAVRLGDERLGSVISFRTVDWSADRRESDPEALDEGVEAVKTVGMALKYPTVTESSTMCQN